MCVQLPPDHFQPSTEQLHISRCMVGQMKDSSVISTVLSDTYIVSQIKRQSLSVFLDIISFRFTYVYAEIQTISDSHCTFFVVKIHRKKRRRITSLFSFVTYILLQNVNIM